MTSGSVLVVIGLVHIGQPVPPRVADRKQTVFADVLGKVAKSCQ